MSKSQEKQPLLTVEEEHDLHNENDQSFFQKIKSSITENSTLAIYLVLVVLIGTVNRVTFKIMQYSTYNYSYFISQITTLVYVPINFAVIFVKIYWTKSIGPEQRKFPLYKFAIMGLLDSLQGFFIVVGGVRVPGIMQNLLMQGAVPVTMLFSLAFLRNTGCDRCKRTRSLLKKKKVQFTERSASGTCSPEGDTCVCKVTVNEMEVDTQHIESLLDSMKQLNRHIVLETSSVSWNKHLKGFYSPWQYLGAGVVLCGLVVSMLGSLVGSGGGPLLFDFIFFLATIPTAVSGVYKEIAFKEADDMDVWYLNGWVALFQFLFGLTYAPLAAVLSDLPIREIPSNLWEGFQCTVEMKNDITPYNSICSTTMNITAIKGHENDLICDSCDGIYPYVNAVPALYATLLYMGANILYNVFLIYVIKYGSAALMYIASTLVLPLGSIAFTFHFLLGHNAQTFDKFNGIGLGVILLGLIIYRFVGRRKSANMENTKMVHVGIHEPIFVERPVKNPALKPRSTTQVRNAYYSRLGMMPEMYPPPRAAINVV